MTFDEKVYAIVRKIPRGSVMSYGEVALVIGYPRAARAVGQALHRNNDPVNTPCHRVVFADGSLSNSYAFGGLGVQKTRLEKEGVVFVGEKVEERHLITEISDRWQKELYHCPCK